MLAGPLLGCVAMAGRAASRSGRKECRAWLTCHGSPSLDKVRFDNRIPARQDCWRDCAAGATTLANASLRLMMSWRRRFRRELLCLLAFKLAALALLWAMFFSPSHRPPVDGESTSRHFGTAVAAPLEAPHD